MTFVEQVLAGNAAVDDVDDYVERWHAGEGEGSLADFLGLSSAEYDAWVNDAGALRRLLERRQGGLRATAFA